MSGGAGNGGAGNGETARRERPETEKAVAEDIQYWNVNGRQTGCDVSCSNTANGCWAHGWGSARGGRWRLGFRTGI